MVVRSVERHRLVRENRRLSQAERHRLRLEHHETQRLLEEQRLLMTWKHSKRPPARPEVSGASPALTNAAISRQAAAEEWVRLPDQLIDHYRDCLAPT